MTKKESAPPKARVGESCTQMLINDLRSRGKRLSVCHDGVELQRVIEYDTVQGYARVYKTDERGRPVLTPDKKAAQTETIRGNISAHIVRIPAKELQR